jgi:hypothetical protein
MPFLVARGIRRSGHRAAIAGFRGWASRRLVSEAEHFAWVVPTRLGKVFRFLQGCGAREVVFIGGVRKRNMYEPFRLVRYFPDWRVLRLWYGTLRRDKRDNAVLLAAADAFAQQGMELVSSVKYCEEHLAGEGLLTRTSLPRGGEADVDFGWHIARASADLDIGQSVAVKERDIIAVEAMEGTDAMIRRAGELCRVGGWTLVKVARPDQDMRFDVPTIGPQTLRNLREAGCRCVVVEAGRTLIVDKPVTLELADRLQLAILGRRS